MSAFSITVFFSTLNLLFGIYQIIWIVLTKKGYFLLKEENEDLFSFIQRKFGGIWKHLKGKHIKFIVNNKILFVIRAIFGTIMIVISIGVYILTYYLYSSEIYGPYFIQKL